ncbi:hypothetical protein [Neobittarella massiliensis]|nr:hypothetical protein [Neobittarella massiliensis]
MEEKINWDSMEEAPELIKDPPLTIDGGDVPVEDCTPEDHQ